MADPLIANLSAPTDSEMVVALRYGISRIALMGSWTSDGQTYTRESLPNLQQALELYERRVIQNGQTKRPRISNVRARLTLPK